MESNDSPEILDKGETSDIPGLPSGATILISVLIFDPKQDIIITCNYHILNRHKKFKYINNVFPCPNLLKLHLSVAPVE